jgi:DNA methylase/RepB plasmid partitioning protein
VVELFKDKHISSTAMAQLKKMRAARQIEAAELMFAANNFTATYARALLAATPRDQLMNSAKTKQIGGVSGMHPTVKPVALVADAIKDVSRRGHIVLDAFGGSATTLIAAEKTGRKARLLELDPAYCDVICRRFEAYTGKPAILVESSLPWAEIADLRAETAPVEAMS